ncbi:uncharacterized protein CLUP02_17929 [Colletotrichum lupini]|uniref:Uncharacterized protein n=1 Tax=Colletotrichum lupini TaxID=145971 RepID=A0A9Q8WAU4_9PEZI|nr:uncharacterized protein CLUP02_17929 [Colletotrichum lupini]UQC76416.1 hypothetical protein CLUP02_17929 [Colletotrichum lupini]
MNCINPSTMNERRDYLAASLPALPPRPAVHAKGVEVVSPSSDLQGLQCQAVDECARAPLWCQFFFLPDAYFAIGTKFNYVSQVFSSTHNASRFPSSIRCSNFSVWGGRLFSFTLDASYATFAVFETILTLTLHSPLLIHTHPHSHTLILTPDPSLTRHPNVAASGPPPAPHCRPEKEKNPAIVTQSS